MSKKIWNGIKTVLEPITKIISNIVNFVLLALVYFIAIGIVSVSMKLFGKHFLELKKQNKKSNWHEHKVTKDPLEKYYRTF
jgi:large-conductance mechanosensitive channel